MDPVKLLLGLLRLWLGLGAIGWIVEGTGNAIGHVTTANLILAFADLCAVTFAVFIAGWAFFGTRWLQLFVFSSGPPNER